MYKKSVQTKADRKDYYKFFRADLKLFRALDHEAKRANISMSELIRAILNRHFWRKKTYHE